MTEQLNGQAAVMAIAAANEAAASRPPDVHFGDRDDDVMPHSWAERALTWLHKNNPTVFGDMMLATMNVPAHTAKTRGK